MDVNTAILERLEKVVVNLQENSNKMGQLLAVHNEKLDKQDKIDGILFEKLESLRRLIDRETELIKKGCERDIRKVDERLRVMEKKMWTIFGALSILSFLVSAPGQVLMRSLTSNVATGTVETYELPRSSVRFSTVSQAPEL
tara:strand:+ start:7601 stop:8026 length:426 start_codon:yes stop_codon:yes gene_type:complete